MKRGPPDDVCCVGFPRFGTRGKIILAVAAARDDVRGRFEVRGSRHDVERRRIQILVFGPGNGEAFAAFASHDLAGEDGVGRDDILHCRAQLLGVRRRPAVHQRDRGGRECIRTKFRVELRHRVVALFVQAIA